MKALDTIVAVLLVIGGLNWGLVGTIDFDLVQGLFGPGGITRAVYVTVGLSALYQGLQWKAIQRRWGLSPAHATHT